MSTRGYSSPQEALAAIAQQSAAVTEHQERALAWQREVEGLVGSGRSEDGRVRAEVDVQGLVTGLVVDDAVASRGGRAVTAAVRLALRAAQEDVRERAARSAEGAWGPGSATAEAFRQEVTSATPLVAVEPDDGGPVSGGAGPAAPTGGTW